MKRGLLILAFACTLSSAAMAQADPIVENDVAGDSAAPSRPAPYAKLAKDLNTPDLISSAGPADRSLLKLRFVGTGESESNWVKMTSISIAKVKPADTVVAARAIIAKFKSSLELQKHAKVTTFDETRNASANAFFSFVTTDGVAEQGIAYSPAEGFVSVIQVAYRHGYVHGASDRAMLKAVMTGR